MTETVVANGREVVDYGNFNGQSNISGPASGVTHQVFGLRDIRARPWMLTRGRGRNRAIGQVRWEYDERLTVEETTPDYTARWVVDRRTGFVHADSLRMTHPESNDGIVWQYGPKTYRDGVVLPTVHVRAGMASIVLSIIAFKDYGIRGIPAAAVIDRQGRVAFVGRFPEALREAAKLLGP